MATLYIRNVPEPVAATLKSLAAEEGQALSAYVNTHLVRIAARPSNAEIAARLRTRDRSGGVSTQRILDELEAPRR